MKIIAISGDCSAEGMSDVASIKEVTPTQWKLIQRYQELSEKCWDWMAEMQKTGKVPAAMLEYRKVQEDCQTFGCWRHKYESRTTWAKM